VQLQAGNGNNRKAATVQRMRKSGRWLASIGSAIRLTPVRSRCRALRALVHFPTLAWPRSGSKGPRHRCLISALAGAPSGIH